MSAEAWPDPFAPPRAGGAGRALADAVDAARTALHQVQVLAGHHGWDELDDDTVAELALSLGQIGSSAGAEAATALGRLEARGWAAAEGFVSTAAWWRRRIRTSRDDAHRLVRLASRLHRDYSETHWRWRSGSISAEHAHAVTAGADSVLRAHETYARRTAASEGITLDTAELSVELEELRRVTESQLLRVALTHTPEQVRRLAAQARAMADPDGASGRELDAGVNGSFTMRPVGDIFHVETDLGGTDAAVLRTLLDHFRNARHSRGGTDQPAPHDRDLVTGDPLVVPNKVKDHQAFRDLLSHVADAGLGNAPVGERPHLDIVATLQDLASGTGAAIVERLGVPAPISTARRIACDADVRLVLVDGQYRDPQTGALVDPAVAGLLIAGAGILDYGRTRRIVPSSLRRALALRDRGCAFPGCDRPPQQTQAHHVEHWLEHCGPTSLENTILLCSRHHHFVHEGGWRIVARAGISYNQPGYWQFHPPERRSRL